ncbi:MAG: transglutaminase-like domain-containing protein [Eubacteriales bacterium]|nr:transglutaminase-like domain-containing protein [Eubacteriales bacterium]
MSKSDRENRNTLALRSIQVKLNTRERLLLKALSFVFLWIYTAGTIGVPASLLEWPVNTGLLFAALGAEAAVFAFLPAGESRIQEKIPVKFVYGGILILLALLFYVFWINGLNGLLNSSIDRIGRAHPYMLPYYRVSLSEGMQKAAQWFFILWAGAWVLLLGRRLLKSGNIVFLGMQEGIFLFLQMVSGIHADLVMNLAVLAAVLVMWIWAQGSRMPEGRHRLAAAESVLLLAVFGMAAAVLLTAAAGRIRKSGSAFSGTREKISQAVEDRRYKGESEVLPGGSFADLGSFLPTGKEVLKVTMSSPQSYYLRGFIGSVYEGNRWTESENEKRWAGRDLFYWLHADGFYGQQELAQAAKVLKPEEYQENTITIENIAANRKYLLTPYELQMKEEETKKLLQKQLLGDEGIRSAGLQGEKKYTYTSYPALAASYPELVGKLSKADEPAEEVERYRKNESYYNEYVYANYVDLPENIRQDLNGIFGNAAETPAGQKHTDYSSAKEDILYVLTRSYTYEERLSSRWNGPDLVDDFLQNTKSGYSVHFASAAVLMFRYFGIPARYVEGYLITPSDAEQMEAGREIVLDDSHAHAWAEYYQDGVGWLPFETTPSYLQVMNQAQEFQNISDTEGSSQQEPPPEEVEEEEKEEEQEKESEIDWIFIIECILAGLILLVLVFLLLVIIRIIREIIISRRLRRDFENEDRKIAVRSIFAYSMYLLSVAGLEIRNQSLFRYGKEIEEMYGPELRREYAAIVRIRQEAVYSEHPVSEAAYARMLAFEQKIWHAVYEEASPMRRLQLKLIYLL